MTFTVIGVFHERSSTYGMSEIQKETVIIPFPLIKYFTGDYRVGTLQATADTPEGVSVVERRMRELLKSRHPPEAEWNVQTLTGILAAAKNISLGLTIMLLVIACIALLISGVGIMNIMLVTVRERTREIGVRKAIGASRKEIMGQFLIEAFLISGGGAVIGILIGLAIPVGVQQLLPGNLRVPIAGWSVIVAFLVSSLTGLFFGWLPANQAAKLDPVESLRYE
jgi:putative ABC transport system permease protein